MDVCYHDLVFSNMVHFSVILNESRCIYAQGPSSSPCNSFSMLFNRSIFLLYSLHSYICTKIVLLLWHPVIGMSSCILPLLDGRIFFRCFGMYCFVLIFWPCLDIFLVCSQYILIYFLELFVLIVLLFSFRPNIFQHFTSVLPFLLVVIDFLSVFPV